MSKRAEPFAVGTKIGNWTVVEQQEHHVETPNGGNRFVAYSVVRCACGVERLLKNNYLRAGASTSCGCTRSPAVTGATTKHSKSHTRTYRLWSTIKHRLKNERSYEGISMYEPWTRDFSAFEAFIESLGPRPTEQHTLDRIDPNGDYGPGNLRWADKTTQSLNRRNNRRRVVSGEGSGALRVEIGRKYQMLTVLELTVEERCGQNWYMARVQCDCGTVKQVYQEQLLRGRTKSCGCFKNRNIVFAHKALEKPIEVNGESLTITQWAARLGCSVSVVWGRINKLGWPVEKAVTEPVRPVDTTITANGETLTVVEWAKKLGCSPGSIRNRIEKLGWEPSLAVTTPMRAWTRRTSEPASEAAETPSASFPSDVDPDTSSTVQ